MCSLWYAGHLCAEQLDVANKHRADCADPKQHVFVKLLEQSESASVFCYKLLSHCSSSQIQSQFPVKHWTIAGT